MASRLLKWVKQRYADGPAEDEEKPFKVTELPDGTVIAREEIPPVEGDPPRQWSNTDPWVEFLPTVIEHRFRDEGWKGNNGEPTA
jgi:hypothetical protein